MGKNGGKLAWGVILHRKWVIWNGCSIPDYPCRVLWNKNLCHFTPAVQFGMQGISACYTGGTYLMSSPFGSLNLASPDVDKIRNFSLKKFLNLWLEKGKIRVQWPLVVILYSSGSRGAPGAQPLPGPQV